MVSDSTSASPPIGWEHGGLPLASPLSVSLAHLGSLSLLPPPSADEQSRSQRGLPPGQHQLPAGPLPGRALHHHRDRHLRGRGRGPHRLPLQEQPPMSFPGRTRSLGQSCAGAEEQGWPGWTHRLLQCKSSPMTPRRPAIYGFPLFSPFHIVFTALCRAWDRWGTADPFPVDAPKILTLKAVSAWILVD